MAPQIPTSLAVFALTALGASAIKISVASSTASDSLILAAREIGEPFQGQQLDVFRHEPDNSLDAATVNRLQVGPDGAISRDPLRDNYLEKIGNEISAIEGVSLKYDQDYGYGSDEHGAASDIEELYDGYDQGLDAYDEGYDGYDELGANGKNGKTIAVGKGKSQEVKRIAWTSAFKECVLNKNKDLDGCSSLVRNKTDGRICLKTCDGKVVCTSCSHSVGPLIGHKR